MIAFHHAGVGGIGWTIIFANGDDLLEELGAVMLKFLKPSLYWLLVFLPWAVWAEHARSESHGFIFIAACLAIVPLAAILGRATERIASRVGEGLGGFLNATFGNAAELIIAIVALHAGKIRSRQGLPYRVYHWQPAARTWCFVPRWRTSKLRRQSSTCFTPCFSAVSALLSPCSAP
jgi:hypothetical protein